MDANEYEVTDRKHSSQPIGFYSRSFADGGYNPDVLSCLANLSSDEVFTPPQLANQILDLLPADLWRDPNARFLDPCCKSGVFLREMARRLDRGLESQIPDRQERINHIMTRQLFAIAITELTGLMSRRSLYCSKTANGRYSVCTVFETPEGNIRYRRTEHGWKEGRCVFCGASEANYERGLELETHAYEFIHTETPEEIFKMKFDVIIGNPPYQLDTAGYGRQAKPIYHLFVQQAKKLCPRFLCMIIPSRWFTGGMGLDEFRNEMLHDNTICEIHDFPDATDVFPGVQIKGGICYFKWDRDHHGNCKVFNYLNGSTVVSARPLLEPGAVTFVRYNGAIPILQKLRKFQESSIRDLVSTQKPFGFPSNYSGKAVSFDGAVKLYQNGGVGYVKRSDVKTGVEVLDVWKVFVPRFGSGSDSFPHPILGRPFVGEPSSACTETYLYIGPFSDRKTAKNVISYLQTRFLRFLVMLNKPTQNALRQVYHFVPMQDFSKPWTDEELYQKYGLTAEEIAFIEKMVRPMDNGEKVDAEAPNGDSDDE